MESVPVLFGTQYYILEMIQDNLYLKSRKLLKKLGIHEPIVKRWGRGGGSHY